MCLHKKLSRCVFDTRSNLWNLLCIKLKSTHCVCKYVTIYYFIVFEFSFLCCWPSTSRTPIRPGVFPFRRDLEFLEILSSTRFFRVGWLLSDKNLIALKTSRYKTSPYLLEKKIVGQSQGSNLRSSDPELVALTTELLVLVLFGGKNW